MLAYINVINTKVAKFIKQQSHGGQVTYYLRKTLVEGGGVISHINQFQQV